MPKGAPDKRYTPKLKQMHSMMLRADAFNNGNGFILQKGQKVFGLNVVVVVVKVVHVLRYGVAAPAAAAHFLKFSFYLFLCRSPGYDIIDLTF